MKFKLDYDKWICGNPSDKTKRTEGNYHGEGFNELLNVKGYMCCLGQFSLQCEGITKSDIEGYHTPENIKTPSPFVDFDGQDYDDNELAIKAMVINDATTTTIAKKVVELKGLFKKHKHTIELINFPQYILDEVNRATKNLNQ